MPTSYAMGQSPGCSAMASSTTHMTSLGSFTSQMGGHHLLSTSGSLQLTPSLSESQMSRLILCAERLSSQLPQLEPRAQNSKKRSSKELEQVMAMSDSDPRRMDEIRKYAAIYGRFDCKRRPEKPLTLHEVCVNEAAAQICKLVPALLTRRDELFPLARQVVRDSGFGHSAGIARFAMGSAGAVGSEHHHHHHHHQSGELDEHMHSSGGGGGNGGGGSGGGSATKRSRLATPRSSDSQSLSAHVLQEGHKVIQSKCTTRGASALGHRKY